MRTFVIIANVLLAIVAVYIFRDILGHPVLPNRSEEREFILLGIGLALVALNAIYFLPMAAKRAKESKVGRLPGLWLAAKEAELKKRANSQEED